MDVSFVRVLSAVFLAVVLVGCQSSLKASQGHGQAASGAARAAPRSSDRAPGELGFAPRDYSTERAMGARCPSGDSQATLMTWPIRGACNGPGPAHLMKVIKALEPSIRWSEESLQALRAARQSYVAVPGLGERPDFLLRLDSVWIRSFEGLGESATLYLIQAPFRIYQEAGNPRPWPEVRLREDNKCGASGLNLRAFRVSRDGYPRDVTEEVMPPRPVLTEAESRRYGPHIARMEKACDSEIALLSDNLQHVPTMRWAITDFDPETPLSSSDPRYQGADGWAHFGFVVWNGKSFEMTHTVSTANWPCLAGQACHGGSGQMDHYVIEASD